MCSGLAEQLPPFKALKWASKQLRPKQPSVEALLEGLPKSAEESTAQIADTQSEEASRAASAAARLRKRRAGAAANILTSPLGIPAGSTSTLGGGS